MFQLLCTLSVFLSAFLLFVLEPMFGKMVLPLLGGAPAVWNTCLVIFQCGLLGGYLYAHCLARFFPVKLQWAIHGLCLAAAAFLLPISVSESAVSSSAPVASLIHLGIRAVILPFVAIAATSPLIQVWVAASSRRNPYTLYVASNAGSLAGLLAYPTVIEPLLPLNRQSHWWEISFWAMAVLVIGCGIFSSFKLKGQAQENNRAAADAGAQASAAANPWRWLFLSAVSSSLLVGVTAYISSDVAAVPLFWVIPLALYLITFIITFMDRPAVPHQWVLKITPWVLILMVYLILQPSKLFILLISAHLLAFALVALMCHGELAKIKPPPDQLTAFYLWIALGGALGGSLTALLAPLVFNSTFEYPLALVAACLLLPVSQKHKNPRELHRLLDYALVGCLIFWITEINAVLKLTDGMPDWMAPYFLFGPPVALCIWLRRRPQKLAAALSAFLITGYFVTTIPQSTLCLTRSFFGVYKVRRHNNYNILTNGTTLHGIQSLHPRRKYTPLSYYHPSGPLGDIFKAFYGPDPQLRSVAAVGLGSGSVACYASPGQQWVFYEIDPAIQKIADNPAYFTYLSQCLEQRSVVLGDARLSLQKTADASYDLIILDAFNSDAIPVHLLTLEAFELYLSKLRPGGLIAVHTSNRHLNLNPIVGKIAENLGAAARIRKDFPITEEEQIAGKSTSVWLAVGKKEADLRVLGDHPLWKRIKTSKSGPLWTDNYTNILGTLRKLRLNKAKEKTRITSSRRQ